MNIEIIDKWLNEEYGVSYTELEELYNYLLNKCQKVEQENKKLEKENNKLKAELDLLEDNRIYLNDKIDKAIELLEELKNLYDDNYTVSDKAENILDILKGGNNE